MRTALLLVVLQLAGAALDLPCDGPTRAALDQAHEQMWRGDDASALHYLEERSDSATTCPELSVARLALTGWQQARELAPAAGAAELLGPVRKTLEQLGAAPLTEASLDREYAETAILAAIAAAQDERPEMELRLTHARDLSERLQLRGRRARWPRSFNVLVGELWLEVDRFDDARLAFERAVAADQSPAALVGLARAQARLGQRAVACATWKQGVNAAPVLREAAAADLAHCR